MASDSSPITSAPTSAPTPKSPLAMQKNGTMGFILVMINGVLHVWLHERTEKKTMSGVKTYGDPRKCPLALQDPLVGSDRCY